MGATKVGIVTQARLGSSRLPGKVLLQAGGTTMLAHHFSRLAQSGLPVIVATTTEPTDDALVAVLQNAHPDIPVVRGSEQDVLARFALAACVHELDVVVRCTSDCPLIDGALLQRGVDAFLAGGANAWARRYLSNTLSRTWPRGMDFEVFGAELLHEADRKATSGSEREHVTPYMHQNVPGDISLLDMPRAAGSAGHLRLTLDEADDFALLKLLMEEHNADTLDAEALIALLARHPELVAMNAHIAQKKT